MRKTRAQGFNCTEFIYFLLDFPKDRSRTKYLLVSYASLGRRGVWAGCTPHNDTSADNSAIHGQT